MSDFKAKMHQNRYRLGTPLGELTALPQAPKLYLRGPTSKGKEGKGKRAGTVEKGMRREGREGKGREGTGRGRTTLHTPFRKFLATPQLLQSRGFQAKLMCLSVLFCSVGL